MNKKRISAFLIIALVLTNNSFATFAQYLNRIDPFEKVSVAEKSISNLYEMQQAINSQALMFAKIASISINTTLSEMYPSDVIAYLNGPISYNE